MHCGGMKECFSVMIGMDKSGVPTKVVALSLVGQQLTCLPDEFRWLDKLRFLNPTNNNFESAPHVLCRFAHVEEIDMRGNPLKALSPSTVVNRQPSFLCHRGEMKILADAISPREVEVLEEMANQIEKPFDVMHFNGCQQTKEFSSMMPGPEGDDWYRAAPSPLSYSSKHGGGLERKQIALAVANQGLLTIPESISRLQSLTFLSKCIWQCTDNITTHTFHQLSHLEYLGMTDTERERLSDDMFRDMPQLKRLSTEG